MPDTASITIVKSFIWKGQTEEWGNTYHFTGTTPANDAAWEALGVAIFDAEALIIPASTKLSKIYGYAASVDNSVFALDWVGAGRAARTGGAALPSASYNMAGDQASWIRAKIGKSTKGKNVYVRKYFHNGFVSTAGDDKLPAAHKTALTTLASKLLDGTLPGGFKWSGPQGQTATDPVAATFVTTRTLKRRGKRP